MPGCPFCFYVLSFRLPQNHFLSGKNWVILRGHYPHGAPGDPHAIPNRAVKSIPRGSRRAVRQKVHTPAYASLNGGSDDMVLDLSEILDISESGAAIQTSSSWEISRVVNLCLDLSETKTYLQTTAHVIWADRNGRIGVRFPQMPEASRRKLKEWLFLNAMVGAANWVARHGEPELPHQELAHQVLPTPSPKVPKSRDVASGAAESRPDYTATLTALSAVQREVEAHGTNLDSALQLIAGRAQTFTMAEGSADRDCRRSGHGVSRERGRCSPNRREIGRGRRLLRLLRPNGFLATL